MGEPYCSPHASPGQPTKLTKMNLKGSGEANRRLLIILISLARRNNL